MYYEIKTFQKLNYIIRYPNAHEEGKRYPVIMLLHGAGTRGTDIDVLKKNAFFVETDKYEQFPFITVAPSVTRILGLTFLRRFARSSNTWVARLL